MNDDATPNYAAVREGQCPHGHGPLDVQEERGTRFGWCDECKSGWSTKRTADEDTLNLHIRIEGGTLDELRMGPGLATFTPGVAKSEAEIRDEFERGDPRSDG